MNMIQKTICIVRCDKTPLPILAYIDSPSFVALALSKSVIIWVYKGLAMLIPAERVANEVRVMENFNQLGSNKIKCRVPMFYPSDTIKLPSQIARALVGSDE